MYLPLQHQHLFLAFSLLSAVKASPLDIRDDIFARSVSTADVLAVLEAQGKSNWTDHPQSGGQIQYFPHDVWDAAAGQVAHKMRMARSDDTSDNPAAIFARDGSTGDVSGGVSTADGGKHKASWACLGYGTIQNSVVAGTAAGVGVGALAVTIEAKLTGQWLWTAPVAPGPNTKVKQVLKVAKWSAVSITSAAAASSLGWLYGDYCKPPDGPSGSTTGGTTTIYTNSPTSTDAGDKIIDIEVSFTRAIQ